jgi:GNAT superfamily N-acetyltransferase
MAAELELKTLSEETFADYEAITSKEGGGGCYCAFWHQKWTDMKAWEAQCKTNPEKNRAIVAEKLRAGFHVGVLAYEAGKPAAWICVGPLTDFYWTWKRLAAVGASANKTAGILCLAITPEHRGKGLQERLLLALKVYARGQGWDFLEGYPFDDEAIKKHGPGVLWCGFPRGYERAGFERAGPHWLSSPETPRSIYRLKL